MTTNETPSLSPLPNPLAIVAKGALGVAGGLIAALIAGLVVCFLMDIAWSRGKPGYAYIVWVLVPAIAGFLGMSSAGEWAVKPPPGKSSWIYRTDALRVGSLLLLGGLIATGLLYLLCAKLGWSYDEDDFWVPSSKPHTIAFFIGGAVGMISSWWMAKMEQTPDKT